MKKKKRGSRIRRKKKTIPSSGHRTHPWRTSRRKEGDKGKAGRVRERPKGGRGDLKRELRTSGNAQGKAKKKNEGKGLETIVSKRIHKGRPAGGIPLIYREKNY